MNEFDYMVTSLWRGAHNIGNMRGFDDFDKAKAYADSLDEYEVRVYRLYEDASPKCIYKCGSKFLYRMKS